MKSIVALSVRAALIGVAAGLVPAASAAELEEMIVTAQKRDQSLQEVTAAVTALERTSGSSPRTSTTSKTCS